VQSVQKSVGRWGKREEKFGTGLKSGFGWRGADGPNCSAGQTRALQGFARGSKQQIAHRIMQSPPVQGPSQLQGTRPGHANRGMRCSDVTRAAALLQSSELRHLSVRSIVVCTALCTVYVRTMYGVSYYVQLHPCRGTVGRISARSSCDSSTRTVVAVDSLCTQNCVQSAEYIVQYTEYIHCAASRVVQYTYRYVVPVQHVYCTYMYKVLVHVPPARVIVTCSRAAEASEHRRAV
jgi:hypothetical protein